jgi:uncharacterized protein YcbK (DUF882 family)
MLRARGLCAGLAAAGLFVTADTDRITAASEQSRTIAFKHIHTNETLSIVYKKDGKYVPEALEKINWIMRDWRKNQVQKMDPQTIDLLWEMHTELGSHEPINIICGYRSHETNEMLRRTVGGQASQSQHITGKAIDATFPDVPLKRMRYSALVRERGGVGYYPTSATPFVHIDTDRVRAWPRATRMELALLFPNGRTQHVPDDGGSITPEDVRRARASNSEIAQQIAELQEQRAHPKAPIQVASLGPSLPQLLSPPKPVERQVPLGTRPTDRERAALAALADEPLPQLLSAPVQASRPRSPAVIATSGELKMASADAGARSALDRLKRAASLSRDTTFVPAPAYDEEHPEELSYRPFPIAPFLTTTSSADDPALARMVHPDLNKTLEMLDQAGSVPPMRLRPGSQAAQLMWAQQFKGEAIDLSSLIDLGSATASAKLADRKVQTRSQ